MGLSVWEEGAFEPYREVGYGQQDDPLPEYACAGCSLVTACVIPIAVMEPELDSVRPSSVTASAMEECPMRRPLNLLGLHFLIRGYNNTYFAHLEKKNARWWEAVYYCS